MEICILGSGCVRCEKLAFQVSRALRQLGLKASVVRVERESLVEYLLPGVGAPGLIIDGELVWAGDALPSQDALEAWIQQASKGERLRKAG